MPQAGLRATGHGLPATGSVGYVSPFVPPEWIAAHRLLPRRLSPSAPPPESAFGLMGICPFARALVSACQGASARAIVLADTCDQVRRAAELIPASPACPPVFLMHVPRTWQGPAAGRFYRDELVRLGAFMVGLGGQAPTGDGLAEVMLKYDSARRALRDAAGNMDGRRWAEALVSLHETGELCLRGMPPAPPAGVPLALLGEMLMREELAIYDLVERFGGRIALDATEGGLRGLPRPFDPPQAVRRPMEELAAAYFEAIPTVFARPNSRLYQYLSEALARRGVRGLILLRRLWCDLWLAELPRLREATGLPVLDLEMDEEAGAAPGEAPSVRLTARIESFLEMLR